MRGNEKVNGHPIRCYDNGGKTADRYTVAFIEDKIDCGPSRTLYGCLGMSDEPFHPQGIGQHSDCMLGPHLGKRIAFASLPEDCQSAVRQDLNT